VAALLHKEGMRKAERLRAARQVQAEQEEAKHKSHTFTPTLTSMCTAHPRSVLSRLVVLKCPSC
jgi:hypothetical protein